MAVEQTQVLPAPVLSKALEAFVDKFPPMMGQAINTSVYDPQVAKNPSIFAPTRGQPQPLRRVRFWRYGYGSTYIFPGEFRKINFGNFRFKAYFWPYR